MQLRSLSVIALLIMVGAAGVFGQTGQLSELGECPVWWSKPIEVYLTLKPAEAFSQVPRGGDGVWYGTLHLGIGKNPAIPLVFWPGDAKGPRLWVDLNGNKDLTDDGDGFWMWKWGWQGYTWRYIVLIDYGPEGRLPYCIRLSAHPDYDVVAAPEYITHGNPSPWYSLIAYPGGFQQGSLEVNGETILFAVYDANGDGRYDDVEHTGVLVDNDGDGKFCLLCPHETFFPGATVVIGNRCYSLREVSPSGRRVRLEVLKQDLCSRPVFLPGWPAPDFKAQTVEGRELSLSDLRGQAVVLSFLSPRSCAVEQPQACSTCSQVDVCKELESFGKTVAALEEYRGKVQLILILTDPELPSNTWFEQWAPWEVIWDKDGRLSQLYYGCPGPVIIDREGIIRYLGFERAMIFDRFGCYRHEYTARFANELDLLWALTRVLADQD
jgi:peroxiredoxin